jgi:thiol-disulfide isomerase/thioredoxin
MRYRLALMVTALLASGCERQAEPVDSTPAAARAPQGSDTAGEEGKLDRSRAGTPAPDFAFEDPEGEPASFADFRGKPLLVNFWATWCAPCVAEMPMLDALAAREEGRLQVLALSQDLEGQAKVDAFFEKRKFSRLEPYIDPQLNAMAALKIGELPTTILYDANGRELWRITGMEDWEGQRAAALIAEASPSREAAR